MPALAMGFLFPTQQTPNRRTATTMMARTGVQAKMERVLMRNGLLNKPGYGYQVVEEQSEFDGDIEDEAYDLDDGSVFEKSPLFAAPRVSAGQEADQDEEAAIKAAADETITFDKGQIIKGVVVSPWEG